MSPSFIGLLDMSVCEAFICFSFLFSFLSNGNLAPEVGFAAICPLIFPMYSMFLSLDLNYPRLKMWSYEFHSAGFGKIHPCFLCIFFCLMLSVNFHTNEFLFEQSCYHCVVFYVHHLWQRNCFVGNLLFGWSYQNHLD